MILNSLSKPHSNWPDLHASPSFYDALSSIKSWPLQILATALHKPRSAAARIPMGPESQPAAARLPAATMDGGMQAVWSADGVYLPQQRHHACVKPDNLGRPSSPLQAVLMGPIPE